MSVEALQAVRARMLPMLEITAAEYDGRTPAGYPLLVDTPEQGTIGLELDPSYALYIVSDGQELYAETYRRNPRTDPRSSASRMRHGGAPLNERRPITANVSDQRLRNLIAELKSHFNQQPGLIHISDS